LSGSFFSSTQPPLQHVLLPVQGFGQVAPLEELLLDELVPMQQPRQLEG
jgi:hypothetical protein